MFLCGGGGGGGGKRSLPTINYEKIIIRVKYCDLYTETFSFNAGTKISD